MKTLDMLYFFKMFYKFKITFYLYAQGYTTFIAILGLTKTYENYTHPVKGWAFGLCISY